MCHRFEDVCQIILVRDSGHLKQVLRAELERNLVDLEMQDVADDDQAVGIVVW